MILSGVIVFLTFYCTVLIHCVVLKFYFM